MLLRLMPSLMIGIGMTSLSNVLEPKGVKVKSDVTSNTQANNECTCTRKLDMCTSDLKLKRTNTR